MIRDVCYTECGLPGVKIYSPANGYVHMCRYTFDRLIDLDEHECDDQEQREAESARDDAENELDQAKDKVQEVTAALQECADDDDADLATAHDAILEAIRVLEQM